MAATYSVYVQVDGRGNIIFIDSDYHLGDTDDYILIDKGATVKHRDAHEKYLADGLYGFNGRVQTPNYKLVEGAVVARTEEEKDLDPYSDEPEASGGGADEAMDIIEGRIE